jgi:hypothetical protein
MTWAGGARFAAVVVIAGIVRPLGAQTVRPAVVEFSEQARGKFELVNETLFPLTVVLEPRGFHVEPNGELIEEPLDTTRMRVKISAMSFRIPPRETYTVFYEATAKKFSVVVPHQQHPNGSADADGPQRPHRAAARRVHAPAAAAATSRRDRSRVRLRLGREARSR